MKKKKTIILKQMKTVNKVNFSALQLLDYLNGMEFFEKAFKKYFSMRSVIKFF